MENIKAYKKNLKGDLGLFTLVFMLSFVLMAALAVHWYTANKTLELKVKVGVSISKVDTGTWATSFFKISDGKLSYLDVLGSVPAENYKDVIGKYVFSGDSQIGMIPIKVFMDRPGKPSRSIEIPDKLERLGKTGENPYRFFVDIAIPGGEKAVLEIREDKIV